MALLGQRARKLKAGILVGVLVGAAAAAAAYSRPAFLDAGELWTYDVRARHAARPAEASRDIVLIDVDEQDIRDVEKNFDLPFPWPRVLYAYLTKLIASGHPRAIVFDWFFQGRGSLGVNDAGEFADAMRDSGRAVIGVYFGQQARRVERGAGRWGVVLRRFRERHDGLLAALELLAFDRRAFLVGPQPAREPYYLLLAGYASAAEVTADWQKLAGVDELAEVFGRAPGAEPPPPAKPLELTDAELTAEVTDESLVVETAALPIPAPAALVLPTAAKLDPPLGMLAVAARLGNVVQRADSDGVMRLHSPVVVYDGKLYPSLALATWQVLHPGAAPRFEGRDLVLGDLRVPLDEHGRFGLRYHGDSNVYRHFGAYKLLRSYQQIEEKSAPEIDPAVFKDKVVVVSATADALVDVRASPLSKLHLGAAINATAVDNLEAAAFIRRAPPWLDALLAFLLALMLAAGMGGVGSLVRSSSVVALATLGGTAALLGGYWLVVDRLFDAGGLWLAASTPMGGAVLAAFGALMVTSALERNDKRFIEKALNRYTSAALTRQLMEHPEYLALGGARREISVYFSDVANFTTITEGLSPEALVSLLNEYLTIMTDIVDQHDGYVDKYIGDAVMAFWGGLVPDDEHARKACRAAVAMRDAVTKLATGWKQTYGVEVFARAGVNSGTGVVGNMGSQNKYNYTAMGDTVNIASRLEGANKPYGTALMISEATWERVGDVVDARELDYLTVKGKAQPIKVFEVLGERGKTDPELAAAVARFHEALARYRAREFGAALAVFKEVLTMRPDDGPARAYLARCEFFLQEPPGPDWDGVWHMKEK